MSNPKYTISVLVINEKEITLECIESILKYCPDAQIIVTDNGSAKETQVALLSLAEKFKDRIGLIRNETNLGFGRAHNKALEFALGDYFVTINNDAKFFGEFLDLMRGAFRDPAVGQVGAYGSCCQLDDKGTGILSEKVEYIEASCMMIPRFLGVKLGLFSPDFRKAYCEDVDLSFRIRKLGYKIAQVRIPWEHKRATTARSLPAAEDLEGCRAYNHAVLMGKYSGYMSRRSFRERILVKRDTAHGDVLLTTPIIRELKRQNAEAEVFVKTFHPQIFSGSKIVREAGTDYVDNQFDRVIDLNLAYERDPEIPIVEAYANAAGIEVDNPLPEFHIPRKARGFALRFMTQNPWSVFHVGPTSWPGRDLELHKFRDVSKWLRKAGFKIALVGKAGTDCPIEVDLDARGLTESLAQLAAIIERSSLFVGIDSLPMHFAQAAKIPLVAVFGCIDPRLRLAPIPFFKSVQAEGVGCLGCHHIGPAPKTVAKCLRSRPVCMERITVDQIKIAIRQALEVYTMQLETSKIRDEVLPFLKGSGIDIGCGRDKITPDAFGFDDDPSPEVNLTGDASGPLPFEDGRFDWLYSSHCLEDIFDTEKTLREWLRIVKPGGVIALYVPHPELYKGVNLEHKHQGFTVEQLSSMLKWIGVDILHTKEDSGDNRYSSLVIGRRRQ